MTNNAGIEGITRLSTGHLLLAAERQPRGLLEVGGFNRSKVTSAWTMNYSPCRALGNRPLDFSDLTTFGGAVYALERNTHVVAKLERRPGGYIEREFWSYGKTENDPRWAYEHRKFGLAEGLAINDRNVFIVLDTNHDRRLTAPGDRRPLLFIFEAPHRSLGSEAR